MDANAPTIPPQAGVAPRADVRWRVSAVRVYLVLLGAFCLFTGLSHFLQQLAAFALFFASVALPRQERGSVPVGVWAGLSLWAAAVVLAKFSSPFGPWAWLEGGQTLWILLVLPAILRAPAVVFEPRWMRGWLGLLLAGAVMSLLVGLWQVLLGDDPIRSRPLDGMWFNAEIPRARGLQTNAMTFAGLLSLVAVAIALHLRSSLHSAGERVGWRWLWWLGVSLCVLGVLLSGSRVYLLVLPLVLALLWAGRRTRRLAVVYSALCLAAIVAALLLVAPAGEVQRIDWLPPLAPASEQVGESPAEYPVADNPKEEPTPGEARTAAETAERQAGPHTVTLSPAWERLILWRLALETWLLHPLTGVGPNSVERAMHEVAGRDQLAISPALGPHNLLLEILVKTGLVGLWAFGLAVLWIGRALFKQRRLRYDTAFALGTLMLLVGFVESALFDSGLKQLFLVLLGLHVAAPVPPAREKVSQTG